MANKLMMMMIDDDYHGYPTLSTLFAFVIRFTTLYIIFLVYNE